MILFARIFGETSKVISATAKAKAENIQTINGLRPLAVVDQVFQYGTDYILKQDGGDALSGNYGIIALGGTGARTYGENFMYGYEGNLSIDDIIYTETGNKAGDTKIGVDYLVNGCTHTPPCTYDSYNPKCPRIIFIPVINTLELTPRSSIPAV